MREAKRLPQLGGTHVPAGEHLPAQHRAPGLHTCSHARARKPVLRFSKTQRSFLQ